ncbi:GLUT4 regulating protein TUG-domain-containing protein [Apiospora arundinis]|uniref:GLUT4 regulating protein TUG-domain-containing protein n=1 Tax=Apiospora arundinis TaxID=335852 RepID=A0ABR2J892_9PEZI
MAAHVKVVSTDLRQATIKVNPGTYLQDIVNQACDKFGKTSGTYLLKHKEKQLDLSNTFRNSGLVSGAKLELIVGSKTPSAISIALYLPERERKLAGLADTERLFEKLASDVTIWKVLRHFESHVLKGKAVNITGRGEPKITNGRSQGGGQLYYETPVLQIEQRSLSTFVDFQKTLGQLGYNSGSVAMRLSFQKTDRTFADAMADISRYFEEEEQAMKEATKDEVKEKPAEASGSVADIPAADHQQDGTPTSVAEAQSDSQGDGRDTTNREGADKMDVDTTPSDPLQPISVFSAPSSDTPHAARTTEPDDIYIPGIQHAQLHQQRLKNAGQNKRLLSDQELAEEAAERQAKLAAVKEVKVRVRFPDTTQAVWNIHPDNTGEFLYKAVRGVMASPSAKFELAPAGVHTVPIRDDGTKLIAGYKLVGNTVIILRWHDSVSNTIRTAPFLKEKASLLAQEVEIPEIPQVEEEAPPAPGPSKSNAAEKPKGEGVGLKKGMPKWLKLGNKK